ncbi:MULTISPECIES: hypothetical protein [unclassified Nonomuraea]
MVESPSNTHEPPPTLAILGRSPWGPLGIRILWMQARTHAMLVS